MAKHKFGAFGATETAKNGKEYFEVRPGQLEVGDEIIFPAVAAGTPSRRKSKGPSEGHPEILFAVIEGLGTVYERKGIDGAMVQFQRAYIIRK